MKNASFDLAIQTTADEKKKAHVGWPSLSFLLSDQTSFLSVYSYTEDWAVCTGCDSSVYKYWASEQLRKALVFPPQSTLNKKVKTCCLIATFPTFLFFFLKKKTTHLFLTYLLSKYRVPDILLNTGPRTAHPGFITRPAMSRAQCGIDTLSENESHSEHPMSGLWLSQWWGQQGSASQSPLSL